MSDPPDDEMIAEEGELQPSFTLTLEPAEELLEIPVEPRLPGDGFDE